MPFELCGHRLHHALELNGARGGQVVLLERILGEVEVVLRPLLLVQPG